MLGGIAHADEVCDVHVTSRFLTNSESKVFGFPRARARFWTDAVT